MISPIFLNLVISSENAKLFQNKFHCIFGFQMIKSIPFERRWIKPGRRDSIASHSSSKRGRDSEVFSRANKPRADSPDATNKK